MRLHRFFVDQPLTDPVLQIEDKELLHQWSRVLRYTGGEQVMLLDGKGTQVTATLVTCTKKGAEVRVDEKATMLRSTEPLLTLYFSPLKRELTEWVFQKGTELGVDRFQPILCERTVRDGFNPERTARILKEASEQSGRLWLPEFFAPIPLKDALAHNSSQKSYFASLNQENSPHTPLAHTSVASLALFVGPEGGWTLEEESQARGAGCHPLSLSRNVLRAETACIAGITLLRA